MYPILFKIPLLGGIPIYTYGMLVALAFLCGIFWSTREAKIAKVDPDFILDLAFYLVIAGIVGARIVYIIVDWERTLANPFEILKIWQGGLVYYGGFIGALLVGAFYIKLRKQGFRQIADIMTPGLALGHVFGRLGCFSAGCCYGRPVAGEHSWAIIFPFNPTSLAPAGIALYPTQLIEAGANFLIFLALIQLRRHKKFSGQIFFAYVMIYGVVRSVIELFRGDKIRGYLIPDILTTSQFISAVLVLVALVTYFWLEHRSQRGRS